MLQQIRDKITGWFASLFLGAIAVVFIFWGIRFESTTTSAAVKVNGEGIPTQQVRRLWQERQSQLQQQMRAEVPEAVAKVEQQKLLNDLVRREVLLQHANEMGYQASDQDIAHALELIPALQVDGKFSRDRYAALLRQQGRSEAEFEQEFRRDLQISQLQNGIGVSAFATPGEIRRRIELEGETRDIAYLAIPAAKYLAKATVNPADVTALYEKNKAGFMTQETVSLQYVELKLSDVAAAVPVTDQALHQYYDQVAAERYLDPERRRARHILVEAGKDDAAAKKKADDLYAKAKAGADFAKLAAENSDDPGSKTQGGELGWATKDTYVPAFAEALFSMQKGEIRGPVKTQFGYHIIQLEDVQPAHQRTFDEVRADLERDYRNERAQSLFYEKSQQLADDSFAALSELDSVAKKHGLQLQTIEGFTRQGGGPFGGDRKVIDAVFSDDVLQQRQNSPALNVGNDAVVVVRVTDHKPATQRPIDEVRPQIEESLRQRAALQAAEAAAKEEQKRLEAGTSLAEVAKGLGLQAAAPSTVTRTQQGVAPSLLQAVFAAPKPAPGKTSSGTATMPGAEVALFVVSAVHGGTMPMTADGKAQMAQEAQRVAGQSAGVEFSAYLAELVRNAKVKISDKVFEQ